MALRKPEITGGARKEPGILRQQSVKKWSYEGHANDPAKKEGGKKKKIERALGVGGVFGSRQVRRIKKGFG